MHATLASLPHLQLQQEGVAVATAGFSEGRYHRLGQPCILLADGGAGVHRATNCLSQLQNLARHGAHGRPPAAAADYAQLVEAAGGKAGAAAIV